MLDFVKTQFELIVFFLLLPTTILSVAVAIVTIRSQWRGFLEAIGVKFMLTAIYRRKSDGKELKARDLWQQSESLRVLKTGLGSQVGYYAHEAGFLNDPVRIGGTFWCREYEMVIEVKDLTKGPVGPSWYTEEKKS